MDIPSLHNQSIERAKDTKASDALRPNAKDHFVHNVLCNMTSYVE